MALKRLQDRVGTLAPSVRRLETAPDAGRPWRNWYNLARWARLRMACLRAARFTCAMCGRIEADTSKLVADHVVPHRGDPDLFWDMTNLQCLCWGCHSRDKQAAEAAGRGRGV